MSFYCILKQDKLQFQKYSEYHELKIKIKNTFISTTQNNK